MKAILQLCIVAILCVMSASAGDSLPKALDKKEVALLDKIRGLTIGMSEEEFRKLFPDLGPLEKYKSGGEANVFAGKLPDLTLAGLKWRGHAEFTEGKLVRVRLYTFVSYPEYKGSDEQTFPRHEVRKVGLLIAAHYQHRIGEVTERYAPNRDCPAGNPFGLRHAWRTRGKELSVEFFKNASQSSLEIALSDWLKSQREQKEEYEHVWPLKPAPRALLREMSRPQK